MAEFVEVMRQMKRMCRSIRKNGIGGCRNCKIEKIWCEKIAPTTDDTVETERAIMQWAAAHPEPKLVYPTFAEWQKEMFPETNKSPMHPCAFVAMECPDVSVCAKCAEQTRIPEDVAKKLGIEPREESNG